MNAAAGETKRTYVLQMDSPEQLRPKRISLSGLAITQVEIACPELNRFLFEVIGRAYRWGGRVDWGPVQWQRYADRPELQTWVAYVRGSPAGYYELELDSDQRVRIQCLGLLDRWIGKGLGGQLLTSAVQHAWSWGGEAVWLTTCTHDHAHALRNYQARGFRIVRQLEGPANPPWDRARPWR